MPTGPLLSARFHSPIVTNVLGAVGSSQAQKMLPPGMQNAAAWIFGQPQRLSLIHISDAYTVRVGWPEQLGCDRLVRTANFFIVSSVDWSAVHWNYDPLNPTRTTITLKGLSLIHIYFRSFGCSSAVGKRLLRPLDNKMHLLGADSKSHTFPEDRKTE